MDCLCIQRELFALPHAFDSVLPGFREGKVRHLAHACGGYCNEADGMRGRPPRAWRAATDASGELKLCAGAVKRSSRIPSLVRRAACHDRGTAGVPAVPRITSGRRHPRTIDPYSGSVRRRRKYSTRECRPSVKTRNPIGTPRKNDSARSRIAPAPSARCSCRVLDFQRWTTQFATSDADRLDCSANTGDREKTPSRREHATSSTQNPVAIAICQLFIGDLRVDAARGGIR